jgi:hypothetical protein
MIKHDANACLESNSLKERGMGLFQTSYNFNMSRGKTSDAWKWLYGLLSLSGKVLNPEWFDLTTLSWTNRRTYFAHTNCHKIVTDPVPITWAHNGSFRFNDFFFFFVNSLCFVIDCSCFIRGCTSWPHSERSELYISHTLSLLIPSRKKWIAHITYFILCMNSLNCAVWVGRSRVLKWVEWTILNWPNITHTYSAHEPAIK